MRTTVLRLATFLVFLLFAVGISAQDDVLNRDFGIGGGGGAGGCYYCDGGMGNGTMWLSCAAAESGGGGWQNCRMERYPEGTYCFVDGDECCVD